MSRQSHTEVAEAARRRLELLGQELDRAGLRRVDDEPGEGVGDAPTSEVSPPGRVAPPGRHLRPPPRGSRQRVGDWLGDRVPDSLRGRTALEPGPVLLVIALVALAAAATTFVVLRTGGGGAPAAVPQLSLPSGAPSQVPPPAAGGATVAPVSRASAVAGTSGTVTVHVAGKVRRPGIATLPAGSRVVDAVRRAGGARPRVDLSSLNLARVLVDGEQILVGRSAPAGALAAGASTAAPEPGGALVNLNTATAAQLETLPGVGPVTAQKILDWRSAHGAFSSVEELMEVDGIGEKTLAELAPHVTL